MLDVLPSATAGYGRLLTSYRFARADARFAAILLTDRAVLVFGTERASTDQAAVDLADFHEGCRGVPVLPVVLVAGERVVAQRPLPFAGALSPVACTRLQLPGLLAQVAVFPPAPGFDPATWEHAAYHPVPALLDAACRLYAGHDVPALLAATSGRGDLARTRAAVQAALGATWARAGKAVLFVTGAPGAGKTLCGLDLAFAGQTPAVFLTGNPALLHVLRAALARDAAERGLQAQAARQRVAAVIQPLHRFRDSHAQSRHPPAERLLVIDEAQRCWTAGYAGRKTRNRPHPLCDSEPGLILDAMARHEGACAIVCLLGGGQEIHAGEGGLAGWGEALGPRPGWLAYAPPGALGATDPRQRLPALARLAVDPAMHLGQPVRAWRAPRAIDWVEAMLHDDADHARALAGPALPFRLTRSLDAMRAVLRASPDGGRAHRAGLVASSGARRLRAEGLGGLLWHQDEHAVADWFLQRWPDIRSADALEVAGTEFGVQGLELDQVGLCWDADLVRTADGAAWQARAFRANAWTLPAAAETLSNRLNAYRVLLTRARRQTIVWVPHGDARDPTRDPARYDAIAAYLEACGMLWLEPLPATRPAPALEPALL